MQISRRKFLGMAGASALVATCSPNALSDHPLFNIPPDASPSERIKSLQGLSLQTDQLLGYPINMAVKSEEFFSWREQLFKAGLNQFGFNNVGNPYHHSHYPFNTHHFEKELIERFGAIYGFPPRNTWGFLSNSGTDSNMHGIYIGRTLLESRSGVMPKIYFTKEAHYSIQILRNLLNLDWVVVGTNADGSMDTDDLAQKLRANPNHPALVVATIGTTFKGAIDSIDAIQTKLKNRESYLHLDAALFGGYLPHTPFAADLLHEIPATDTGIKSARYDSIAVSCHKFFGFPSPAGLFITTRTIFEEFQVQFGQVHDPEYILQIPGTITCSRGAVKPAEFYFFSTDSAFAKQNDDAKIMLDNADYLLQEMNNHYAYLNPTRANNRSSTIYFKKPSDTVVNRYSLATMRLTVDGQQTPYAHVVVMPHVTKNILDKFLTDLG
jgi:glutamate/tyrosine decarboxylase-like PLP-dependent enzyme